MTTAAERTAIAAGSGIPLLAEYKPFIRAGLIYFRVGGSSFAWHTWPDDGPFTVDGIDYWMADGPGVCSVRPMIEVLRDGDGGEMWRPYSNLPPATDAQLDRWVREGHPPVWDIEESD